VHADRLRLHAHHRAVDGDDLPVDGHAHDALRHLLRVVQHRARLPARHERSTCGVGAVGERLVHGTQAGALRGGEQGRAGQAEDGEPPVVRADGVDHGGGLALVRDHGVVERAVRLDVGDTRARDTGEGVERAELVEHRVGELARLHVEEAPAEAREVGVADLRAHRHAAGRRGRAGATQRRRVAGVEAARDVRAAHDLEQRGVITELPPAVGLADVAVEVHARLLADRRAHLGVDGVDHRRGRPAW
jgi:hypothetical protein